MKKIAYTLLLSCASLIPAYGQHDLTLHFLQNIPQSGASNPAFIPERGKIFIGLSVLSGTSVDFSNTGFRYRDVIQKSADDSLDLTIDHLLQNALRDKNHISLTANFDLLSVRFKVKNKLYLGLTANEIVRVRFTYPRDLFKLAWYGNGNFNGEKAFPDNTASFDGIGVNATHYRQIGLSGAYVVNDKITAGASIKYLIGLANIYTERSHISLKTDASEYDLTLATDIMIRTSIPDSIDDAMDYVMNMKNTGLAFDLGGVYKLNDKITLSASLTDLGYIKWNSNQHSYYSNDTSYTYKGVYLKSMADSSRFSLDPLLDTLESIFNIKEGTGEAYKTVIDPSIFISGTYQLSDKHSVGALLYGAFFRGIHPAISLNYMRKVGKIFTVSGSYSIFGRNVANVGIGFALKLGPFQLYHTQDNFLWWMMPKSTNNVNYRFGINLMFGGKIKDDTPKDSSAGTTK